MLRDGRSALARALIHVAHRLSPEASSLADAGPASGGSTGTPQANSTRGHHPQAAITPPTETRGAVRPRDEILSQKRLAVTDREVAGWIDREVRAVQSIVASGLRLLDLSELHARYADRWERVGTAIRRIVESTIDRHLSPRDLWVRGEGDTWIILIEGADPIEAGRRTRQIAADVTRRLVGDAPGGDGCAPSGSPGDGAADLAAGLAAGIQVHSISVELDEPPARIRTIKALLASWARTVATAREREREAAQVLDHHVRPSYQPVFNPRLPGAAAIRAISGQRLQLVPVGRPLPPDVTGELRAALDAETVRRAIELLGRCRGLVFASVHFDTLAYRPHACAVVELLTAALPAARRRLVLEVRGILPAVPQPRILSVLTAVYPLVLAVAVGVDPHSPRLDQSIDRFVGRSHRLATIPAQVVLDDPEAAGAAVRLLARRGMRVAVLDVPDEDTARRLRRGRACRFLAGDGVAPATLAPIRLRRERPEPHDPSRSARAAAPRRSTAGPAL